VTFEQEQKQRVNVHNPDKIQQSLSVYFKQQAVTDVQFVKREPNIQKKDN